MKKILSIAVSLFMLISVFSLTACNDEKKVATGPVVSTENFTVTKGMFAYFFNVIYSGYSDSLESLGIDNSISLKKQDCPYVLKGEKTWFTYFVEMTKDRIASILALCQEAYNAGITLDETEMSNIDSYIADIAKAAKNYGSSMDEYVSRVVNTTFSEAELRKCLEMEMLASKYSDEFYNSVSFTDEEIEAYYLANSVEYDSMDLYAFTIAAETDDIDRVREDMSAIATAETAEDYLRLVREYIEEDYARNEIEITEEELEAINAFIGSCLFTGITPSDFNLEETANWAATAKVGETYMEESDGSFTVFMVDREMSRDRSYTRNVRHVLFSIDTYDDDTIPSKVYSDWGTTGFTEERLIELVAKYSEDEGSVEDGGLYTNVAYGDMVTEFNDWLFDESRVAGDHGIVETEFGWHLMYYVSENDTPVWKVNVISDMANEAYNKVIDEYYYALVYNDEIIADINA